MGRLAHSVHYGAGCIFTQCILMRKLLTSLWPLTRQTQWLRRGGGNVAWFSHFHWVFSVITCCSKCFARLNLPSPLDEIVFAHFYHSIILYHHRYLWQYESSTLPFCKHYTAWLSPLCRLSELFFTAWNWLIWLQWAITVWCTTMSRGKQSTRKLTWTVKRLQGWRLTGCFGKCTSC